MTTAKNGPLSPERELENREWIESLEYVLQSGGAERVHELLHRLSAHAAKRGVQTDWHGTTPYINTIPRAEQAPYPGSREIERRIKSLVRWNAMAMVVRANREVAGIGGHISTFASSATLYEVAQNHFFHGKDHTSGGDIVFFQGHAAPGMYARAFLEGRLDEHHLENFRRELAPGGGLSSYPHPWLMPEFWEYPTVSMGLAPIMAIYQARFMAYLEDRALAKTKGRRVWAFLGDGEMDEPESMGALTLASREGLDNLSFVINCNLQRLDGPVRGNGRIVQELEGAFRGAGWKVFKVILGDDWDPLLEADREGLLAQRLGEIVDGQAQRFSISEGAYIREHFFGTDPRLAKLVEHLTDEQLAKLRRGGHDPAKVFAAYKAALEVEGQPTVILAQTIKGYGLGEAGEGRNVTHQQKKLNERELRYFRSRFGIPLSDEEVAEAPFYRPDEDSEEIRYLKEHRRELGGFVPERRVRASALPLPPEAIFAEYREGSGEREISTTMAYVQLLSKLLRDDKIGKHIVPIVPDEARTFGMESLFRQVGIYAHKGQLYEPVDRQSLLYYNEKKDGAILEEGINEAGSMSSFIAAGSAHAAHGVAMIPFFSFYSMFGFQRVGDLIWAAADARARGFLMGGTAGRTTLAGEGLQHQDGHSHLLAYAPPNLKAYDPAYAYELAIIIQDGLRRMFAEGQDLIYYVTMMNETYRMPAMPEGEEVVEGILRGIYRFAASNGQAGENKAHLLGSGAILNEALAAQAILEERYKVPADVWSVTSYKELYRDCIESERANRLRPQEPPRLSYLERAFAGERGVIVAASDYMKAIPLSISPWLPGRLVALGTDGFGRSDARGPLRDHFEVDARHIAFSALAALLRAGALDREVLEQAAGDLQIDTSGPAPHMV